MQEDKINLTSWNKPWPLEIDWLDSYVNLSSFSEDVLEGLFVGYRLSKRKKYFFQGENGCWMEFKFGIQLTQEYYLKYYAHTNKSMLLCTPYIPMRPDVFEAWTKRDNSLVWCYNYYPGLLGKMYRRGTFRYVWNSETLAMYLAVLAAIVIIVSGLIGNQNSVGRFI